ncbi:MAG: hypothetical protein WD848_00570 [Dehalococcoidia bacterium]
MPNKYLLFVALLVVVFSTVLLISEPEGFHSMWSSFSQSPTTVASSPVGEVSASQLKTEWRNNVIASEQRYEGKVWIISGRVSSIDRRSDDGVPFVTLSGESSFNSDVHCYFKESDAQRMLPGLTTSNVGRPIIHRLQGTVRGPSNAVAFTTVIEVDDCSVVGRTDMATPSTGSFR